MPRRGNVPKREILPDPMYFIPELLDMVDEKKVSFNPAVELSYLSPEQQQEVIIAMDDTQNAPSFSQAKRIKKLAQEGNFTSEAVVDIMPLHNYCLYK